MHICINYMHIWGTRAIPVYHGPVTYRTGDKTCQNVINTSDIIYNKIVTGDIPAMYVNFRWKG